MKLIVAVTTLKIIWKMSRMKSNKWILNFKPNPPNTKTLTQTSFFPVRIQRKPEPVLLKLTQPRTYSTTSSASSKTPFGLRK